MTTNEANTVPRFVVMTSSAKMPASVKSAYRNVAVLETDGTKYPAMISEHARGVVGIVWRSGACSVGKTERRAYRRALVEAEALAERLNARDATLRVRLGEIGQVRAASGVADALEGSERVLVEELARVGETA